MNAEEILTFDIIEIAVYGLCEKGRWYYWNGEKKTVTFKLQASIKQ